MRLYNLLLLLLLPLLLLLALSKTLLHYSDYSDSSSTIGQTLVIGRVKTLEPTWTRTTLTLPSGPGMTSTMRPMGHWPRGVSEATTTTASPIFIVFCCVRHCCLEFRAGTSSIIHRCQLFLIRFCTYRHRRVCIIYIIIIIPQHAQKYHSTHNNTTARIIIIIIPQHVCKGQRTMHGNKL